MTDFCHRYDTHEFCNMCARFVQTRFRQPITDQLKEMYLDIYGDEMNLEYYAPSIVCWHCQNSLRNYVKGKTNYLRVRRPSKWSEYKNDHSNCFYHLVHVVIQPHKYRTYLPPRNSASFVPPEYTPTSKRSHH